MQEIEAFNLYRVFFGTQTSWIYLFEVIFRTIIMFGWTLLNVRYLGKRNLGQLTPFEFLITFALGSATGDPMFYPEVPLLHGMMVISTIVLLEKTVSLISRRSDSFKKMVQGEAVMLIENGKIIDKKYTSQNMNKNELLSRLRIEGIEDIGQVKYALLEPSGRLSVIKYAKGKSKQDEKTVKAHKKSRRSGVRDREL